MSVKTHITALEVVNDLEVNGDLDVSGDLAIAGDFTLDGAMTTEGLWLSDTTWEDLRFPANAINLGVANAPEAVLVKAGDDYGQLYTLEFNKSTEEEVYMWVQLPHSWKEGSALRPHVHWINHNDTTGNVRWGLEYSVANIGEYFPKTPTTIYVLDACEANVGGEIMHQLTSLPEIEMDGKTLSCMMMCRLFRDADSELDTADDDVGLLEFDIHYQVDSLGSREETVK
jgi:hypothetical protein